MDYTFKVKEQKLSCSNSKEIVSDAINFNKAIFMFDDEWEGLTPSVVFTNTTTAISIRMVLDIDNSCIIPWEALTDAGELVVYAEGCSGDDVLATTTIERPLRIVNSDKPTEAIPPVPPTEDVVNQILMAATNAENTAYAVAEAAAAGELDGRGIEEIVNVEGNMVIEYSDGTIVEFGDVTGPQGEQGVQGEQGIQGIQGAQGLQGVRGEKGDAGETGITGDKGDKGDKGDTGPEGPMGPQGMKGNQGVQGPRGFEGFAPKITEYRYNDGNTYRLEITNEEESFITPNLFAEARLAEMESNLTGMILALELPQGWYSENTRVIGIEYKSDSRWKTSYLLSTGVAPGNILEVYNGGLPVGSPVKISIMRLL